MRATIVMFPTAQNLQRAAFKIEQDRCTKRELGSLVARKPIVAGIQGAAIGGGLGLSLVADFRVASPEARFAANFCEIGDTSRIRTDRYRFLVLSVNKKQMKCS